MSDLFFYNENVDSDDLLIEDTDGLDFDQEDVVSESLEGDQLIAEAVIQDTGLELSESEIFELISEQLLSERSIVRLDKKAKRSHAEQKAVIVMAKEANDPLYRKLVTVYKQRRKILSKLEQKYNARAKARVRKVSSQKKIAPIAKKTAADMNKNRSVFRGTDLPTSK